LNRKLRDRSRSTSCHTFQDRSWSGGASNRFSIHAEGAPELPLTDAYGRATVTLPLFAHMTIDQQDLVVDAVCAALAATNA